MYEMLYKTLLCFVFYSPITSTNSETCMNVCHGKHKGQIVFYDEIFQDAENFKILTRTIRISPEGSHSGNIISCLNVTNLGDEKSQCEIVDGGVGKNYISLQLSSEIGKKLEYEIEVSAYKKTDHGGVDLTTVQVCFIVFSILVVLTLIVLLVNPWKKKKTEKKVTLQSIIDKLYSSEEAYSVYT
ncbi:hypothetical protein CBL_12398 [Carabus blaptoides fortunei]